jgi:hypothetical protein
MAKTKLRQELNDQKMIFSKKEQILWKGDMALGCRLAAQRKRIY